MKNRNDSIVRLTKEYQNLVKSPVPNILALPHPNNLYECHFIIYGLKDCDYENGFYHGYLSFPAEYPWKPPALYFITPNGKFQLDK
jgi:ubiquitin-conjugating enzyme E2 J2